MVITTEQINQIYAEFLKEDQRLMDHPTTKGYGHPFVICTVQAAWLQKHFFPKGVIRGFMNENNPTAHVSEDVDGHDFLVVEGRYIVDFWPFNVEGMKDVPLFIDMQEQPELAEYWYGRSECWDTTELEPSFLDQRIYE